MYGSISKGDQQFHAGHEENRHRREIVRGGRLCCAWKGEIMWNRIMPPMARDGMDSVRNIQMLQLEDSNAKARH